MSSVDGYQTDGAKFLEAMRKKGLTLTVHTDASIFQAPHSKTTTAAVPHAAEVKLRTSGDDVIGESWRAIGK